MKYYKIPLEYKSSFYILSVSKNLTDIQFKDALDLGKVLWNGRYDILPQEASSMDSTMHTQTKSSKN